MVSKKEDYQRLEHQNYYFNYKFNSRIILYCLLVFKFIIFVLWVALFFDQKLSKQNRLFQSTNINLREKEILINHEENLDNYDNNIFLSENNSTCVIKNNSEKFDCHPEPGGNENSCLQRRCCWDSKTQEGVPACYYSTPYNGYKILNITNFKFGLKAFLSLNFPSAYPKDIKLLEMNVQFLSSCILHVKVMND